MRKALIAGLLASLSLADHAASAADTSSWLSAGGGWALQRENKIGQNDTIGAMSLTLGVGTTPVNRVVFGGVLRSTTYFSQGTDLGFAFRVAQGSYARGSWGLGADLGLGARWYKAGAYGRYPVQGKLLVGAPWGVQAALGADFLNLADEPAAHGFVALLELDLLRLTVNRQGSTERYWRNPAPAGGRLTAPSDD